MKYENTCASNRQQTGTASQLIDRRPCVCMCVCVHFYFCCLLLIFVCRICAFFVSSVKLADFEMFAFVCLFGLSLFMRDMIVNFFILCAVFFSFGICWLNDYRRQPSNVTNTNIEYFFFFLRSNGHWKSMSCFSFGTKHIYLCIVYCTLN